MCILFVTLLKVVGYYDLSVLSMSVMGFPKKKFGWWVGGVSPIQFFFKSFQNPFSKNSLQDKHSKYVIDSFDLNNFIFLNA